MRQTTEPSNFFVSFQTRWIHPTDALNHSRYSNPAIDALVDAAARETHSDRRVAMLREIAQRLRDECPWIWIPSKTNVLAHHPDVGVGEFDPLWQFDLRKVWK